MSSCEEFCTTKEQNDFMHLLLMYLQDELRSIHQIHPQNTNNQLNKCSICWKQQNQQLGVPPARLLF
jgi:hypothetical protein